MNGFAALWADFGRGAWLGVVLLFGTGVAFVAKSAPQFREALQLRPIERSCAGFLEAPVKPTRWVRVVGCDVDVDRATRELNQWRAPLRPSGQLHGAVDTVHVLFGASVEAPVQNIGPLTGMVLQQNGHYALLDGVAPERLRTLSAFALGVVLMVFAFLPFARRYFLLKTGDV